LQRIAGLLGEVIKSGSKWDRIFAADALGRLHWHASEMVATLTELMKTDPDAREVAVRAVGDIGPPAASEAIPQLAVILSGPSLMDFAREEAAKVLGRTLDPRAVEPLLRAFESEPLGSDLRFQIVVAFGKLGPMAARAVPHLMPTLRTDDDLVLTVIGTLASIGAGAGAAVPCLRKLFNADFRGALRTDIFAS